MEIRTKNYQEDAARMFCDAIKELANKPANLENLESYLSRHFSEWLKKYAADPANLAGEMRCFSTMDL